MRLRTLTGLSSLSVTALVGLLWLSTIWLGLFFTAGSVEVVVVLGRVLIGPSNRLMPEQKVLRPRRDIGFVYELQGWVWSFSGGHEDGIWYFNMPLWVPFLAGSALSFALLHRRAHRETHCRCGYDRTGLKPASKCPECGKMPI